MVDKLIRDGKVAILVSRGYGAGWSTWADNAEALLFDPEIVRAVLGESDESVRDIVDRKYPDEYAGGINTLEVHWLPVGTTFDVQEYDGYESLVYGDRLWTA